MLAAITALALFFSFLAAFYGYLAAPQQRLLPAPLPWRYAGDMAWRAALAALLLWVSRFGGYGVLVAIAAVLVGLGVLPLLALMRRFAWREWLLGGAARPDGWGRALAAEVSARQRYVVEPSGRFEGCEPVAVVAAIDLGIKARTPWQLAERGVRVHVLPQTTTFEEVLALHPDGVFFSNGPGDPGTAHSEVELLRGVLDARIPFFGICLGNQIFGRALGYGTYKLSYGHRGINQPVLDRAAGRVEITAHNHGFAVDAPIGEPSLAPYDGGRYGRVEVSHVGLNDHVVEGLRALDVPAFSVQFHPEAAAGPHDGEHLFDRFVRLMADHRHRRDGAAARTIQEER